MGNRAYALLTGVFIVVLATTIAIIAYWMSGGEQPHDPYIVVARTEITGLKEASPVLYRGVPAGRVERIRFNPNDFREIFIRIQVASDLPITEGTHATLRPQGVTGLSQMILHDDGSDTTPLATSANHPPRIPLEPGVLEELTGSGTSVLERVEGVLAKLNALLNEENRTHITRTLGNLETATARLDTLEARVASALGTVPETAEGVDNTLAEIRSLARSLQGLPPKLETLATNANGLVTRGRDVGRVLTTEISPAMTSALGELSSASRELQRAARVLQSSPESVLRGRPARSPGPGEQGYQERER